MKKIHLSLSFILAATALLAQTANPVPFTNYKERMEGYKKRKALEANSLVSGIAFRSIGPNIMSGRVVDIEVSPHDPTHFYVAYASGGLWKTENNGLTFTPLFDYEAVITIGDIAIDWNNGGTIWIGTGESNSSRSSYSGVGVFKSADGGKSWTHLGLEETHHIGKIVVHPTDPNTVWVAAIGHLYSPNKDRGVYKTSDGGKTWKQVLFKDENTGAIDMQIDPANPQNLYATLWYRTRRAWNFTESGKSSGIYKSTDGGATWSLVSGEGSGFPTGDGVGRIGLAVYPQNSNIVYAILDNQQARKEEKKEEDKTKLTKDKLRTITTGEFLKLDDKQLQAFMDENGFPGKYSAAKVKEMVKSGKLKPIALVEYLEDANAALFDTKVTGGEVYRSDDAGKTWKKTHSTYLEDFFYTYGYYFGKIWVSPYDENKIYIGGLYALRSDDGGKTFQSISGENVHADHHALWSNPARKGHLINGNDGGVNISYDDGKTWFKCNTPSVGQFYAVNVDMETPHNVYGGLQDNGVWWGSSQSKMDLAWTQEGKNPFQNIMGGDGMQVQVDTRDNTTVYTGYQFGNYFRINKNTGETKYITPQHDLGERPYRWNWQSPILISKHNQDIIYMGSNHFHRSMNKGDDFKTLSGDLTNGGKKGDVTYGTLTTIDESPLKFGLIYTGSDDGAVNVSKDGGSTWTKVSSGLQAHMWVSRVCASHHSEGRVYVSLNGYRWDNFTPYLYVSDNYGSNWTRIGTDLPLEPINVVKEDPANENILYVGTDNGLYVSLNRGKSFMRMGKTLPAVAVHDLVIHPRDKEIVVGTHGRSIYVASVKELQQMNDSILAKSLYVFDLEDKKHSGRWGAKESMWEKPNEPEYLIPYFIKDDGNVTIEVKTKSGLLLASYALIAQKKGLNYFSYDLSVSTEPGSVVADYEKYLNDNKAKDDAAIKLKKAESGKYYLQPGTYTVVIKGENGASITKEFTIKKPKKG
ncbi:MAG: glycosyl hydrolase [Bacteroidota bacterium]